MPGVAFTVTKFELPGAAFTVTKLELPGADIAVTKFDKDGEKQFSRLEGTSAEELATAVATGTDGSLYVTGYGNPTNLYGARGPGDEEIVLMKFGIPT